MGTAVSSVAVIGAGISGLVCARELSRAGVAVTVLEKSRSLGGRCATRKWREHVVDHGPPVITAGSGSFHRELIAAGWQAIAAPITGPEGTAHVSTAGQRLYGPCGNNRLGKYLAEGLEVRRETPVESVRTEAGGVEVDGTRYDAVVCSAPWPQTARMLGLADGAVSYEPCLTIFLEYQRPWTDRLRERFAIIDPAGPAVWSGCENHKVGRIQPGAVVLVAQASPQFSRQHLEDEPDVYVPLLREAVEPLWELEGAEPVATFAHRWRFAYNVSRRAMPELPGRVFVCGDSRVPSRVEEVWHDGQETARRVLASL